MTSLLLCACFSQTVCSMKFFSPKSTPEEDASLAIPFEIKEAVRIMGSPTSKQAYSSDNTVPSAPQASGNQKASPFLSEVTPENEIVLPQSPEKKPASLAPEWNPPIDQELKPLFDEVPENNEASRKKKLIFLIGGLTLILVIGGLLVWYFLKSKPEVTLEATVPTQVENIPPVVTAPIEPPYALDKPNYLSVDTETVTAASLRELLRQSGERMQGAKVTKPVEFLLTDKNNNPIAFTRFAYLMKLELKPEVLPLLGESFSLYLYNDAGQSMVGLGLSLAENVTGESLLALQKEGTLPFAFRMFLYDGLAVPKEGVFRSGLYQAQGVRYVNIDASKNISFDYALRGKSWFIGTSKETLRAILDK